MFSAEIDRKNVQSRDHKGIVKIDSFEYNSMLKIFNFYEKNRMTSPMQATSLPITSLVSQETAALTTEQNKLQMQQAFFDALTRGDLPNVKGALKLCADPNQAMPDGNYPLHIAVQLRRDDLVITLLKFGAYPLVKNTKNETPNDVALRYFKADKERELKNTSSEKRSTIWDHTTMDYLTSSSFYTDGVKQKIQQAFFDAVTQGNLEDAKHAQRHNAKANRPMPDGNYPLHIVAEKGLLSFVTWLLGSGVDPFETNRQNQSARDLAQNALTNPAKPFSNPSEKAELRQVIGWLQSAEIRQREKWENSRCLQS